MFVFYIALALWLIELKARYSLSASSSASPEMLASSGRIKVTPPPTPTPSFVSCCGSVNVSFPFCRLLQVKLEEALELATDFHNSLQDFVNWLTQAEQTLNTVSPASLILETIMFQIDEHKVILVQADHMTSGNDINPNDR